MPKGLAFVAAAVAMRRIKSVTTMRRRIDMKAASALLHVLVIGLCECLVVEVSQAPAAVHGQLVWNSLCAAQTGHVADSTEEVHTLVSRITILSED